MLLRAWQMRWSPPRVPVLKAPRLVKTAQRMIQLSPMCTYPVCSAGVKRQTSEGCIDRVSEKSYIMYMLHTSSISILLCIIFYPCTFLSKKSSLSNGLFHRMDHKGCSGRLFCKLEFSYLNQHRAKLLCAFHLVFALNFCCLSQGFILVWCRVCVGGKFDSMCSYLQYNKEA